MQVDVFTETPYRGNPLAVVLDGTGLSTEAMQHFTNRWHAPGASMWSATPAPASPGSVAPR